MLGHLSGTPGKVQTWDKAGEASPYLAVVREENVMSSNASGI